MKKIIANNLKTFREVTRYTQDDVAHALGITRQSYSNYEAGDVEIPYDILEKVSYLFGCDMHGLFEENENAETLMLASALRFDGLTDSDRAEMMRFNDIVKSYLKMEAIDSLNTHDEPILGCRK